MKARSMKNPEQHQAQDERTPVSADVDFDTLLQILVDAKIPVDQFGTGGAKTVQHLLNEVADGESVLSVDAKGKLHRELSVLWVDVISTHANGDVYALKEDRQIFNDGREKRRQLNSSIGEKLKPGEEPVQAVTRALAEELGIQEKETTSVHYLGEEQKVHTPDTYPGLESSYYFYKYATVIAEEAFKPEGYVEYQADKTNYYVWELIRTEK